MNGIDENTLKLYWCKDTLWRECSNSGVNTVGNYVWAIIDTTTSPSLEDLSGTPFTALPAIQHFPDVPPSKWFFKYVEFMYTNGMVSGYGDGTFKPYNPVTRAQFCKMICNMLGIEKYE
ncbi:MAG: S-layer homology domain-containing protein, partial [Candidatus Thorarchaeota archaeon]